MLSLSQGELAEKGSWDDLVALEDGGFAAFVRQQSLGGESRVVSRAGSAVAAASVGGDGAAMSDGRHDGAADGGDDGAARRSSSDSADDVVADIAVPLSLTLDHIALPPPLRRANSFCSAEEERRRRATRAAVLRAKSSDVGNGRYVELETKPDVLTTVTFRANPSHDLTRSPYIHL